MSMLKEMTVLMCKTVMQDEEIKNKIKNRMNEIEQNAMNDDIDDEVEQLQEPKRKRKINNYQQESMYDIAKTKKVKIRNHPSILETDVDSDIRQRAQKVEKMNLKPPQEKNKNENE